MKRRAESVIEISFRQPMPVSEVFLFSSGNSYSVCPRCHLTLEREYQCFCDRCGQALDWSAFAEATIISKF